MSVLNKRSQQERKERMNRPPDADMLKGDPRQYATQSGLSGGLSAGTSCEIGYGLSPFERHLLNEGSAEEILDEYQWRMSNNRRHDAFVSQCSEYLYKVVSKDKQ